MMNRAIINYFLVILIPITSLFLTGGCTRSSNPDLSIHMLRCEYRNQPSGIDFPRPRLSWVLTSGLEDQKQVGYQILVASSLRNIKKNQGDLWDTRKITSGQNSGIVYSGMPLQSRMDVFWKVRVWDKDGKVSPWSEISGWTMGLLDQADWKASWIADFPSTQNQEDQTSINGFHGQLFKSPDHTGSLTIDLGAITDFDTLRLYPARPYDWADTPGFLFPVRFKLECSNQKNFSDTRLLVDQTSQDFPNPGDTSVTFPVTDGTGRYIRLTVIRMAFRDEGNYAFALNEIGVFKGTENLAVGASVYAPNAIVAESWKPEFLTDGKTHTADTKKALPATYVRKSFTITKKIVRATAYLSARGLYEFYLNGKRVGDQQLAPEWTSYEKRIAYQTYDVSGLLNKGENTAAAILGEGWYAGNLMLYGRFAYGRYPEFIGQIEIEFKDGSKQNLVTDESWKTTIQGPIVSSGIYSGESYDARLEQKGWDINGFDDSSWSNATAGVPDSVKLVWLRNEPIMVEQELHPLKITEPEPGTYILDFGQNMVGWCRISGQGTAGKRIRIRHGEAINEDGTLYTDNLRKALQTDYYTPNQDGLFEYQPRFTYHGYRFIEITGLAAAPAVNSVTGKVFHSSSPLISHFECSDSSVNRLMENILWTQRANLMSSPNDCPQRDERFGWMGDIQAFAQTGVFNMNLAAFFPKFAQDTRDGQSDDGRFPDFAPRPGDRNTGFSGVPAWGDAGVFVPWTAYVNYADTQLLADQFDAAARWIDYIRRNNPDLIWRHGRNNDYNDWLNGDEIIFEGWPKTGGAVPNEVFATAFFAHSTQLVARMAKILGRSEAQVAYSNLFKQIQTAFNEAFVTPDGHIRGNTQGGYALALNFNLLPDELRPRALQYLVENIKTNYHGHLSTGIQTTHRAMLELSKGGYGDVAWALLQNRSFPSWMYMIDNGATTIWERWDGFVKGRGFQNPGMNSLNHWALGSVGEWVWRNIIGLNPDEEHPGWKHFTIAPQPGGGVTWANGDYESIHGKITCSWKIENRQFMLDIVIPTNTTATISLPRAGNGSILKNNKKVEPGYLDGENAIFEVESGKYSFVSAYQ